MDIGHKILGTGKTRVLVLHDWFCDFTSYEPMINYLDQDSYTFCFMDLRGYGKSKELKGKYTVDEAADDALDLVNHLKWDEFHLIGHSMSAMIAQKMNLKARDQIQSIIAITPVPACGSPAPEDMMAFLEDAARSNDENARQIVHFMTGNRHTKPFIDYKVKKWRDCSTPQARVAYLHMFARSDFSQDVQGIETPYLVVIGDHDAESHSKKRMETTFQKYFPNTKIVTIANSGHYPMQETPVYLATTIHEFLSSISN